MAEMIYRDASRPESERVEDLLSRMTIEEKLAQLAMGPNLSVMAERIADGSYPAEGYASAYCYKSEQAGRYNEVQKYQIEHTRLGIPLLLHGESLHGFMMPGSTVFPQALGLGATFDPALVGEIADVAGREAYLTGVRQTYAPNLDLSREPRWGRCEENYGEDPYLTSRMAVSYIRALQSNHVASSPKHYLAHGSPESGINIGPVHAGEREVRETMLEPFAAAFTEAKAMSVMPAYSELDGIPIHANRWALTDLLRGELGFDGYAVSDFGAIGMMHSFHHVAPTMADAAEMALLAGIDHEAGSRACMNEEFCRRAREGEIPIEAVDEAVRRTLRVKFRLGLFEDPYAKPQRRNEIHTAASIALARRAAQETPVLLENNGLLPLKEKELSKIAVVGPLADSCQLGDYSADGALDYAVSLYRGLCGRLGEERVLYAEGAHIARTDDAMIREAVGAAESADAVLVVLGDNSNYHAGIGWGDEEGGGFVTCGEGFDNSTLELPDAQLRLLREVSAVGKPLVLILECGRPYCLGGVVKLADAVLCAWYPGEQGGNALCDLLFGDVSPSGRLPVSFPRAVGSIPCFYNHKMSAGGIYHKPGSADTPGRDYVFDKPGALYPFGYGLSYAEFAYSDLTVSVTGSGDGVQADVRFTLTNTGACRATETALVFLRQHYCPVTPFVRRLRAFERVTLEAGESREVCFTLRAADFTYIDEAMKPRVGHGTFSFYVGTLEATAEL